MADVTMRIAAAKIKENFAECFIVSVVLFAVFCVGRGCSF